MSTRIYDAPAPADLMFTEGALVTVKDMPGARRMIVRRHRAGDPATRFVTVSDEIVPIAMEAELLNDAKLVRAEA